MRLGALIAIFCGIAWPAADTSAYVGSAACRSCHAGEFANQSASGHARALSRAADHKLASAFVPASPLVRKPQYRFLFHRLPTLGVQVYDAANVMDVPLEWAFGAGEQAVTFVSRVDRNWYVEHYFSYYPLLSRMDVTPGQQELQARTLPEAVGRVYKALDASEGMVGCFQCHSTGPVATSSDSLQPHEDGVRCEACHGPGGAHVRGGDPKLIRNPKRMSAVELNQFCGQCHRPPAAEGTKIDWNFSWNVRHQPVYLSESACFRKSDGALSCFSCHAPHQALEHEASRYNRVCGSCHAAAHTNKAMVNCIDCHMPRVSPQTGLRFTNHWIGIYREGSRLKPIGAD